MASRNSALRFVLPILLSWLCQPAVVAQTVGKYALYEQTVFQNSGQFSNVWDDVVLRVTLTPPSGGSRVIEGFFYDTNQWKFRFAPDEVGFWTWSYEMRTQAGLIRSGSGSFTCVPSNNPGFVRPNPSHPYRWIFDDGTSFHPFGLQDCINDELTATYPVGGGVRVRFPQYLSLYSGAGLNVWRLSVGNCSFTSYQWFGPNGNAYHIDNLKKFDQYAFWIREAGMRIYMSLLTYNVPFGLEPQNEAKMASVKRYYSYMIARYGALVDFWEIANEVEQSTYAFSWLQQVQDHIKATDPYQHPTAMSWERPQVVDITSPHIFDGTAPSGLASFWNAETNRQRAFGKPVIFSEVGNQGCNNAPNTPFRWRVASWIAFFRECSFIFWNTAGSTWCRFAANVDMDQEFRDNMRALGRFIQDFDRDAVPKGVETSNGGVTGWALDGPRQYGLYLYAQGNPFGTTNGLFVSINPQVSGTGLWIRPTDDAVIGSVNIPAGFSTISVPPFSGDIALKVDAGTVCEPDIGFGGPGNARLTVCTSSQTGATTAVLTNATPGGFAFLFTSRTNAVTPWQGGTLVPVPPEAILPFSVDAHGEVHVPAGPGCCGPSDLYVQFVYTDAAQPFGWGISNAVRVKLPR